MRRLLSLLRPSSGPLFENHCSRLELNHFHCIDTQQSADYRVKSVLLLAFTKRKGFLFQQQREKYMWSYFPFAPKRGRRITLLLILSSMWGNRALWRTSWAGGRFASISCTAEPAADTCRSRAREWAPRARTETLSVSRAFIYTN